MSVLTASQKIRIECSNGLNDGQAVAFDAIADYIDGKSTSDKMVTLRGYAGTGKTFLVDRIVKYIMKTQPKAKIAVTAPTNKAVKVLSKANSIKDYRISYQTIHKLLGLTEEITNDGIQRFTQKKNDVNEIENYKFLFVDEVSMLDDELFVKLYMYARRVKIIFMGDPAQIPPVNKLDCIPFNEEKKILYDFIELTLEQIMRQNKDNPIVESSFEIRNNLHKHQPLSNIQTRLKEEKGIIRINSNLKEERDKVMSMFNEHFNSDAFKADADFAKIIAWRNKTISQMNGIIRTMIFGEKVSKITEGDKLIANKPIMQGEIIIFTTSDEFVVEEVNEAIESVKVDERLFRLKYYDAVVKAIDIEGKEYFRNISILHEDSESEFEAALTQLKNTAIEMKGANRSWIKYYDFMRRYADVNYNYAITAHKSQGSTYKNVFVIEDDLDMNPNVVERNRIKYTSYTRPTDKLIILKR